MQNIIIIIKYYSVLKLKMRLVYYAEHVGEIRFRQQLF